MKILIFIACLLSLCWSQTGFSWGNSNECQQPDGWTVCHGDREVVTAADAGEALYTLMINHNPITFKAGGYFNFSMSLESTGCKRSYTLSWYLLSSKQAMVKGQSITSISNDAAVNAVRDMDSGGDFVSKVTKFTFGTNQHSRSSFSAELYAGSEDEYTMLAIWSCTDNANPAGQQAKFTYHFSYEPPERCWWQLLLYVLGMVVLATCLCASCIVASRLQDMRARARLSVVGIGLDNPADVSGAAEGYINASTDRRERAKASAAFLRQQKRKRPWLLRPGCGKGVRGMPLVSQPPYDFIRYFIYTNDVTGMVLRPPGHPVTRVSAAVKAVSLWTSRFLFLAVWHDIFAVSSVALVTREDESTTYWTVMGRLIGAATAVFFLEMILRLSWNLVIAWKLCMARRWPTPDEDDEESFSMDKTLSDSAAGETYVSGGGTRERKLKNMLLWLVRHLVINPEYIGLVMLSLAMVVASSVLDYFVTCEVFIVLLVEMALIECVKTIWCGPCMAWGGYMIANSIGRPDEEDNPYDTGDNEFAESVENPIADQF